MSGHGVPEIRARVVAAFHDRPSRVQVEAAGPRRNGHEAQQRQRRRDRHRRRRGPAAARRCGPGDCGGHYRIVGPETNAADRERRSAGDDCGAIEVKNGDGYFRVRYEPIRHATTISFFYIIIIIRLLI